jgi:hypothetical protein
MQNQWIFRVLGAILLVIGIVAAAVFAYNLGLNQAQTAVAAPAEGPTVHGMGWWNPGHLLLFSPFLLCLIPMFLGLFVFFPMRLLFGPRRPHMHMHGRWHCEESEVPFPIREWHRHMHEKDSQEPPAK